MLAISGHNVSLGSSDFTLVPELYSNVTLVRGPFLQMPTAGAISVAWRTDALTDSAVDYGADTNYSGGTVTDPALVREHLVTLPALPQATTMFYRIRSGGVTLAASSSKTPRGSSQPYRFAVYGDFGWSDPQTSAIAFQVNAAILISLSQSATTFTRMASPDRTTHSGLYRTTPSTGALRFSRPSGITM